jgi:outer membrane lipoprotein carrier protein
MDQNLTSLTADFNQFVRWDESGNAQEISGSLDYSKPDRLRVENKIPEEQTVVADGKKLWVFRRSTGQAIETTMERWKQTQPFAEGLLDFGSYGKLLKSYNVAIASVTDASAADGAGHKRFSLVLTPKDGSAKYSLTLALSTRDFFPTTTELRVGAVSVRSRFSNIRFNPPIEAARFSFAPPAGTEIFKDH